MGKGCVGWRQSVEFTSAQPVDFALSVIGRTCVRLAGPPRRPSVRRDSMGRPRRFQGAPLPRASTDDDLTGTGGRSPPRTASQSTGTSGAATRCALQPLSATHDEHRDRACRPDDAPPSRRTRPASPTPPTTWSWTSTSTSSRQRRGRSAGRPRTADDVQGRALGPVAPRVGRLDTNAVAVVEDPDEFATMRDGNQLLRIKDRTTGEKKHHPSGPNKGRDAHPIRSLARGDAARGPRPASKSSATAKKSRPCG